MADGKEDVRAYLAARGYRDPALITGLVRTSRGVGIGPSYLPAISLDPLKEREVWSLGIKNALCSADGFKRDVFLRATATWTPRGIRRN